MRIALTQIAHPASRDLWSRAAAALTLYRSRHALRTLGSHRLKDIDLSRAEALTGANRAAWDAPRNWTR